MRIVKHIAFGVAAMGALAVLAAPSAEAQFYKGKNITMLVPVPGGSGLDLMARTVARHMEKHIAGNPNIVPRNMPGGGGVSSLNYLSDKGRPDGLIFNFGPWNAAGVIAKLKMIRYNPSDFGFIGASSSPQTTIMRTDVAPGMKTVDDIVKVELFNIGGRTADRELDLAGNLALDIMGVRYRYIPGFRGMAKIKPALLGNEVQAGHSGYTGFHKFFRDGVIKEGKALALWYHSYFDINGNALTNADITEFDAFHVVYKRVHGKMPSGDKWEAYKWLRSNISPMSQTLFTPKGTPQAAIDALRAAYAKLKDDPDFNRDIKKITGIAFTFVPFDQGAKILKTFRNVSPEILAVFKEMAKKGEENVSKKKRKK